MKAVVFTLDALFALMIAAAGITIILYFAYSAPTPAVIQYSTSSALLNEMAAIKLSAITGIPLAQAIVNQSLAYNQSWPNMIQNPQNSGGNPTGPSISTVAFTFTAPYPIMNGTIVAGYGKVYFGSGNMIYALNATTGNVVWTKSTLYAADPGIGHYTPSVNSTLLYDGMLIYTTPANTVALNAYNGSQIWSANVPYTTASGEPDDDESVMHLAIDNGKLITGGSAGGVDGDESGYPLYALYANNGTLAGISPLTYTGPNNYMTSLAVYDGEIVPMAWSYTTTSYKGLEVYTPIYNQSYQGAPLVLPFGGFSGTATDVTIYSNVIAIGESSSINFYPTTGGSAFNTGSTPGGATVSGTTSYNGHIILQSTGGMEGFTPSGTETFSSTSLPSITMFNDTPVQSSHNIYAVWSNGWISEENLSTGTFSQSVQTPYSNMPSSGVNINPHMALAYGKLFASMGQTLIAFGTCQADKNSTVLAAIGTMYINNEGSCADYLLNSLQNSQNMSFTINNKSIITTSYFNGLTSTATIPYSPKLAINGPFTVSMWFSSNSPSASFSSDLFQAGLSGTGLFDIRLKGISAGSGQIISTVGTPTGAALATINYPFNLAQNKWYNLVVSFSNTGWTMYLNGNALSGSYSGTPSLLGTSSGIFLGSGINGFLQGSLAGIQVYNTSLNQQQARQLYSDGIAGGPVDSPNLVAWFPLAGDANGYGNAQDFPGFDTQVTFTNVPYNAIGIQNAASVSSQNIPELLFNYTKGTYGLYNVGVYSWR